MKKKYKRKQAHKANRNFKVLKENFQLKIDLSHKKSINLLLIYYQMILRKIMKIQMQLNKQLKGTS